MLLLLYDHENPKLSLDSRMFAIKINNNGDRILENMYSFRS